MGDPATDNATGHVLSDCSDVGIVGMQDKDYVPVNWEAAKYLIGTLMSHPIPHQPSPPTSCNRLPFYDRGNIYLNTQKANS